LRLAHSPCPGRGARQHHPGAAPAAGCRERGQAGYYTIKPSDTLIRIGLETGQSWRDIAAWNNIENPNRIEVGQVIRIVPPVGEAAATAAASPVTGGMVAASP
jgi:lipoprotein NlpD